MNISDLTPEQRQEVLKHLRLAAIARATQWDHELAIEAILERDIDVDIEDLAYNVDLDANQQASDFLTWLTEESLFDWIPDEEA